MKNKPLRILIVGGGFGGLYAAKALAGSQPVALQAPVDLLASFGMNFAGYWLLNTEEIAWRGYALPRLLARYSRWYASLILGVIWALFHVPLFLIKGGPPAGYPFPVFLVMIVALSVIFTWLMQHTEGGAMSSPSLDPRRW